MKNQNAVCPVCGKAEGQVFLRREKVPVLNNIICKTPEEARAVNTGELNFYGCNHCGFAWNAAFDEKLVQYAGNYENNQSISIEFQKHLNDVIFEINNLMHEKNFSVIEVGCGQGYFLKLLSNYYGGGGDKSYWLRSGSS